MIIHYEIAYLKKTPDFKNTSSKQVEQAKPKLPESDIIKPKIEPKPIIQTQNHTTNNIISLYREVLLKKNEFMILMRANSTNKNIEGYQ